MNQSDDHLPLQGWTSSPNGRGTIDIITSSLITLALCSWTVLCLNVYPPTWNFWHRGFQKFCMACLTFIGPEFTFQLAIGQWCSARRSVKKFRDSGYKGWTMTHAFLADMGGFVLHPRLSDTEDWVPFPLDAEQVHYLVVKDYAPYSAFALAEEDIEDKNKVDGALRVITVFQILWYFVGVIARAFQGLAISILELATMGFIVETLGTYFFWYYKPMDIGRAFIIKPTTTIDKILIEAGDQARNPYKKTPLDFAAREDWSWTLYWTYWMGVLRILTGINFAPTMRPVDKISDDYYPALNTFSMFVLFFFQTGYASVHISGWNFHFPTPIEKKLWHMATLGMISSMLVYWIVHFYAFEIPAWIRRRNSEGPSQKVFHDADAPPASKGFRSRLRRAFMNVSRPYDASKDIPLRANLPVLMCVFMYTFCRGYVLIEGFVNLRALPPSTYDSVQWTLFLPHF